MEQSGRALEFALDIAKQTASPEIHVAYVIQKPARAPDPVSDEAIALLRRSGEESLQNAQRLVKKSLANAIIHLEIGDPGEQLLELANRVKPDLIVLGTLRHSATEKLLGTVSSHFLKTRQYPLLIVP